MESALEFVISDSGTKKEFSMRTHSIFLNRAHTIEISLLVLEQASWVGLS